MISTVKINIYKFILFSISSKSEAWISRYYSKCDETEAKFLYLQILAEVKEGVLLGNIDKLKNWSKFIVAITNTSRQAYLKSLYESDDNPIKHTNLVILACKSNEVKVLKYIFSSICKILDNLSIDIGIPEIRPIDEDDECHNSFYYAIRSNNVQLFNALIDKWPVNYFDSHSDELDEILSKAYEELKLKNVFLSDQMQISVESRLIDLRFFSENPENCENVTPSLDNIKDRIAFTVENIKMLTLEYSNTKQIDDKFLFVAKFIAKNIHVLKRHLKPTYDRIPWEELEFCLIAFIKSKIMHNEFNVVCNLTLTKQRILMHLEHFALRLSETKIHKRDAGKKLPNLKREAVIETIINKFPPFEKLYNDYEKVADIHSLYTIFNYIELASTVNLQKEGNHLVITRALQVTGEHLKNTLESPKLSNTTRELFLFSAPENTSKILWNLRNSLSHAYSLSRRTEIEENIDFFINIQSDLKKIGDVVFDILFKNEIQLYETLSMGIMDSNDLKEIKGMIENLCLITEKPLIKAPNVLEHVKIMKLIHDLSIVIGEKTHDEIALFDHIAHIAEKNKLSITRLDCSTDVSMLRQFKDFFNNPNINGKEMGMSKFHVFEVLDDISSKIKPWDVKEIIWIILKIVDHVESRLPPDDVKKVNSIISQIFNTIEPKKDKIEWIAQLRKKLSDDEFLEFDNRFDQAQKQRFDYVLKGKWDDYLTTKLVNLENLLKGNALDSQLLENYSSYKSNKELQAMSEMLVLDIMSILGSSENYLTDNQLFLDNNAPLLIGKSLRDHLAHRNALIEILSFDPLNAIILNARKLVSNYIINDKKYIHKFFINNPSRLKNKFDQYFQTVKNQEAMFIALKEGNIEGVKSCIKKGADVFARSFNLRTTLHFAAMGPSVEVVKLIFNQNLNTQDVEGLYPLHIAAAFGRKSIVEFFVKEGYKMKDEVLRWPAQGFCKQRIENPLAQESYLNCRSYEGLTPLHIAAIQGHVNVIEVLLNNGANVNAKDNEKRVPIVSAIIYGQLEVVKTLLQHKDINYNFRSYNSFPLLHIALFDGNLEILKCLFHAGVNIAARNMWGEKRVQVAATQGEKDIVNFFFDNGYSTINDSNEHDWTLLHNAANGGEVEMIKFFIEQGADVNAADCDGLMPIHVAAKRDFEDCIKCLVSNGAIYDAVNKYNRKPLALVNSKSLINLLTSTEKLFQAVKYNKASDVEKHIKAGAFINAKNTENVMPLHYAAWKGHEKVANILLKNQANPNAVGKSGFRPLHYAAKFSHSAIVNALLSNGAIYNISSTNLKIPFDLSTDRNIVDLLTLVKQSFEKVQNGNPKVIDDLKQVKEVDTVKAVMNARNTENKTLIVAAIHNDFPKVELLKQILQGDVVAQMEKANFLCLQENYRGALSIFQNILKKREAILGHDNPGTLDIQICISKVLYGQKNYQESLKMLQEIYNKQKKMLGLNFEDTLRTRSIIALVLHRQGNDKEALDIFQEVYRKQKKMLGTTDADVLNTQFHIALVLDKLKKYEEALSINYEVFKNEKHILGISHPSTLTAQNNIAMVLSNQGKHEEAMKIYKYVYEKRKEVLGPTHSDSLRILHNMATVFLQQKKYAVALKAYQKVFDLQKQHLGANHLDTLTTEYNIANLLLLQGKWLQARKTFKNGLNRRTVILGSNHSTVCNALKNLEMIEYKIKVEGNDAWDTTKQTQNEIFLAARDGDIKVVQDLLDQGIDVNTEAADGRIPLHFAASHSQVDIVNILLKNGADATKVTHKGNTPLHSAIFSSNKEIAENLLQHVKDSNYKNFDDFINVPNVLGSTPLHIAAINSCYEIVKYLLKHGAIYNAVDKCNNATPLDYSENENITNLLTLIDETFNCAGTGNNEIIHKLKKARPDDFQAIAIACNSNGETCIELALTFINKYHDIVSTLTNMQKINANDFCT